MGEIRIVGTGETNGYPYLVCKKIFVVCQINFTLYMLLKH